MKNKKMTRREALETLLMSPIGLYIAGKISGLDFISSALSNDLVNESLLEYKILNLSMNGGAARYYWDLPLKPNGVSDNIDFNPCCITKFGSNITGNGTYDITQVGDYYFPSIWNTNIPLTGGGSTSMKNLADNMLTIRGIHLPQSGHVFGRHLQMIPLPGQSLLGAVADESNLPLAAVGGDASLFISNKGYSMVNGDIQNPLEKILQPFLNARNFRSVGNSAIEASIDNVLDFMKTQSESKHKFLPTTFETRRNAKKMMKREYGNLSDAFNNLNSKYSDLISRSLRDTNLNLAGVEDRAIAGDGSGKYNFGQVPGASSRVRYKGSDLRSTIVASTNIENLSNVMSIMEFMLTEGYTSVCSYSIGKVINNLSLSNLVREDGNSSHPNIGNTSIGFDGHYLGSHTSLFYYTKFYRALSSTTNELINSLKSVSNGQGNMFDKSIITLTGDFNRQPRNDSSGADHGSDGSNFTILSGMIPKLTVIGNTTEYDASNYLSDKWGGSWGVAANVEELGNRLISMGNIASTVCTMLDRPSIVPNDQSLVKKVNGQIESILSAPKNL